MKTLEEHNLEQSKKHNALQVLNVGLIKNGIACPKCGEELFDINPNIILTSYPPQKSIACACGYTGYRVA